MLELSSKAESSICSSSSIARKQHVEELCFHRLVAEKWYQNVPSATSSIASVLARRLKQNEEEPK
jgi:hypothetical protein